MTGWGKPVCAHCGQRVTLKEPSWQGWIPGLGDFVLHWRCIDGFREPADSGGCRNVGEGGKAA